MINPPYARASQPVHVVERRGTTPRATVVNMDSFHNSGKVTVKFVIAGNGSVSRASIKKSTLGNDSVESCLSGRFMTLQFPEPKGNGIVMVSYPLLFSAG